MVTGERDEPAEHRAAFERVEAVGGLVEDDEVGIVDDRRGDATFCRMPTESVSTSR
jgi:hypothetical protein